MGEVRLMYFTSNVFYAKVLEIALEAAVLSLVISYGTICSVARLLNKDCSCSCSSS